MSESGDDDYQDGIRLDHSSKDDRNSNKKRKIQRACDVCRRKKIRCDGPTMTDGKCTNCITYSYDCTYVEIAKKRGPPKGYVESLENRLEKMENLLKRLVPGADFSSELGPPIERNIWAKDPSAFPARAKAITTPLSADGSSGPISLGFSPVRGIADDRTNGDSDEDATDNPPFGNFSIASISNSMSNLNLGTGGHFFGRSSMFMHVQTALDRKFEYIASKTDGDVPTIEELFPHFRPEYWQPNPWEVAYQPKRSISELQFPPDDLMDSLINIYFLSNNCHFPLLHRPTFDQHYRAGLHHSNLGFAEVVLLVCAVASRCCDDPRVLLDQSVPHSAGWKYYEQVNVVDRNMVMPPTLLDLQRYVLAAWYMLESSCNYAAWTLSGIGLRIAQDVGAHRKKVYGNPISPEDESWKRAFWCLIAIDRLASSTMGRIPAIYDSDIDVDLPLEVDDEYWAPADPSMAFQQPADKPAQATAFIRLLKLSSIIAYGLQTIYAVNKSQLKGITGPLWEHQVLAEIDTMLSKWIEELPPHLQWPNQGAEHPLFFTQSTSLYAIFYHTQILVHHPFILSPKKPNPSTPFPSHQICVNAAHSCSHVVDAYRKRSVYFAPWCVVGAVSSAIILLENLWSVGTPFGPTSVDIATTMDDVKKCSDVIGIVERRWPATGKLRDIIAFLASPDTTGFPTSDRAVKPKPVAGVKRGRGATESSTKSGRKSSATTQNSASPPRYVPVLPPMRVRESRANGSRRGTTGAATGPPASVSAQTVGISPIAGPTSAMDYTFPTTPANWYPQNSPHPDTAGAGGPPGGSNGGGAADHSNAGFAYAGYPGPGGPGGAGGPGPGGPNPHAQESFMRSDGTANGVRGIPIWPAPPNTGAGSAAEYQWV
ncbi:hypothetical protein FRC17_009833 [Serendipita sp. 399]|nr:hypothetical protein FRC17_009833 [Serendipita sp. 399]